ncbi:regulator of chromosome condensation 1/beta-lactamase-inhibitor protein II [Rhodocollybia butyracea]|uniref:Regulator of chromosome condensation 1/beta-lactamase-inhibitor protein II n=1 Tax=Rhodocollybia butyracea TaxID=206335 RepID=A0A9P5U508_9AGAR|nr:regulator of chromosome condensation 1/beta-lactamase-inhibitor protein II [Rhodocollybia butyracea]
MFKARPFRSGIRPFSSASSSKKFHWTRSRQRLAATSLVVVSVLAYSGLNRNRIIQNDLLPSSSSKPEEPGPNSDNTLNTLVWGSNKSKRLVPGISDSEVIRTPAIAKWLDNVALRDLALHKDYAACVDARGDVYQWGLGTESPTLILKGQASPHTRFNVENIVQLQVTEAKVYALSASGKIYAVDADLTRESLPTRSNSTWWAIGWLWGGESIGAFQEIVPRSQLSWGEKFISISASDHLLALTSSGRAFAHPANNNANAYGQLGFRKFDVPDPQSKERIPVELVPKSIADPYAKASPFKRATPDSEGTSKKTNPTPLPFCPNLFEIPSLQGVKLSQLVAGGRSSFALTSTGQVLGWGANEYGQIGLGNNVTLDTITVPTEVILWRMTSPGDQTKCLSVSAGGDLTSFTVERTSQSYAPNASRTIELLLCGNGQYGSLGNNVYTNAQGSPTRARSVSNLTEYNDATKNLQPIGPEAISISPTGHVLLTLNSTGGRDLLVWGKNYDSELGNGKRSGLAVPTALTTSDGDRFILRRKKAKQVLDLQGNVWRRGVEVEQKAVAGHSSSAVFWKVSM